MTINFCDDTISVGNGNKVSVCVVKESDEKPRAVRALDYIEIPPFSEIIVRGIVDSDEKEDH